MFGVKPFPSVVHCNLKFILDEKIGLWDLNLWFTLSTINIFVTMKGAEWTKWEIKRATFFFFFFFFAK